MDEESPAQDARPCGLVLRNLAMLLASHGMAKQPDMLLPLMDALGEAARSSRATGALPGPAPAHKYHRPHCHPDGTLAQATTCSGAGRAVGTEGPDVTAHDTFTSRRGHCGAFVPVSGAHPAADTWLGGGHLRIRPAEADAGAAGPRRELHRQQEQRLPAQRTRHQSRHHCFCCPVLQVCRQPDIRAGIWQLSWASLQQAGCNFVGLTSIFGLTYKFCCV